MEDKNKEFITKMDIIASKLAAAYLTKIYISECTGFSGKTDVAEAFEDFYFTARNMESKYRRYKNWRGRIILK